LQKKTTDIQLNEIISRIRNINKNEFYEIQTSNESYEDLIVELDILSNIFSKQKTRKKTDIGPISICCAGDFFNKVPLSIHEDEILQIH